MPIRAPEGYLDITNATLRASEIVTTSNVGIANANPTNTLSIGSNVFFEDTASNTMTVRGNVVTEGIKLGFLQLLPSYDLELTANVGNSISNTVQFTNSTTGFITSSNVGIGTNAPDGLVDVGTVFKVKFADLGATAADITDGYNTVSITESGGTYTYTRDTAANYGNFLPTTASYSPITGRRYRVKLTARSDYTGSIRLENPANGTVIASYDLTTTFTPYEWEFTATATTMYFRATITTGTTLQFNAFSMEVLEATANTDVIMGGTRFMKAHDPSKNFVAIGPSAGTTAQGQYATAVGFSAGSINQLPGAVAMGPQAGRYNQGDAAVAIGEVSGSLSQGNYAVGVGVQAGANNQGASTVAVGTNAARYNQGASAVAVGNAAGLTSQGVNSVAMGINAGNNTQGLYATALGGTAGQISQSGNATAVGYAAGNTSQGNTATAVGYNAGQSNQGNSAVAVGPSAGNVGQNTNAVAIGSNAGYSAQGVSSTAVGVFAGRYNQGEYTVAVGNTCGTTSQGSSSVAVGYLAGNENQLANCVGIGPQAGRFNQGDESIAVGFVAGGTSQGASATAIGRSAGQTNQGDRAVAIGRFTGYDTQGNEAVAIGYGTAETSQGTRSVAMGYYTAQSNQGVAAVAVGQEAARYNQGNFTVALGGYAGQTAQGSYATALGYAAGQTSQGVNATAVGDQAGKTSQGTYATALGRQAGEISQGNYTVAVGGSAGQTTQGAYAVAVGYLAGHCNQGTTGIAVGVNAGQSNQSSHAVAVGLSAGNLDQGLRATAVGYVAGQTSQGRYGVALGREAGRYNQGSYAVALGYAAGQINQPASTFYLSNYVIRDANGNEYVHYNNSTGEVSKGNNYSDDRLKYNEKVITGAIKSLFKLRPEEYDKKPSLKPSHTGQNWKRESGLIAQEIFYSAPEFRHVVQVPQTAGDVENYTPPPSDDPNQDPDYSVWGEDSPSVDYKQFVPYLIKAVQEIVTELPRSKTTVSNAWGQNITGLVVSANANAHKTNTTPIVALSNVYMDKKWYGVVSEKKTDTNDYDTLVNMRGDTQIWVTDTGGPLESGDLVTTSNVAPGYTQKQADELLRSSTVAKVTQDCDFTEPAQRPIRVPKQELSNVTYYLRVTEQDINIDAYEKLFDTQRKIKTTPVYVKEVGENEQGEEQFFHGETQVSEEKYKTLPEDERSKKWVVELELADYEKLTDEEKAEYTLGTRERWFVVTTTKSKNPIPEHTEEVVVQEMMDVLDENGQIVWEETGETEPVYTLVDHGSYKAALVSAKLV